jgi:hypothetical protein
MLFDDIRATLRDLLKTPMTADQRRPHLEAMRDTLVRAKMGVADLRAGAEQTRTKLAEMEREMETARRRKDLAEGIADAETAAVAAKFEAQFAERVALLRQKLAVEEQEVALADRDLSEMTSALKAASLGAGAAPSVQVPVDPLEDTLSSDLDALARRQQQSVAAADADARLAELKRRMGK